MEYINFPLSPSEKTVTMVATDGEPGATVPTDGGEDTDVGAALGSEMQKPDSELQTSPPILENEPPQVGPDSAVPSVSELQATFTVKGEADVEHPSGQDYLHILATEAPSKEWVKEEKESGNGGVEELTAKLNEQLSSPSQAKPKANVPPPPPKKPSRTLSKSTSQEPVRSPPGSGDIKKRASQLQKLLSGKEEEEEEEELMAASSEKTPNSPLTIHQETKSKKVTPPGSTKPMRPAPKPPVSPKSAKKSKQSGKQISQGSLQDEQLQSSPSLPPHSPPTHQAPQPKTVAKDTSSNEYEARLPLIKKKIAERREQQQKESALAGPLGTPEIPTISHTGPSPAASPEPSSPSPPPPPPRQRAPSSPLHSQSNLVSSSSPPPCPPRHSSPTPPPSPLHHRKQMPLPSSPPHQERIPPPTYTPPPPPSPSSTQEQTADRGVPASQFSVDTDESCQPPIPQRTSEMFLVQSAQGDSSTEQESPQHTGKKTNIKEVEEKVGEGKGKKRRFYQDVVLPKLKKVLGSSKEEKEKGKEKKDVEEKQEEIQVKGPSFMNMRQRPLPAEPFTGTDETEAEHEPWEYEPIDTAEMLKQRPVPYAAHFSPSHPSFSPPFSHRSPSPSHLGARSNSPNSVRRAQSFQPFDTRKTGAQRNARAYKYPSPPLRTRPPLITRPQTAQQNTSPTYENGAVDDDGYVDTESSPPGTNLPEYDYPDTRAFRTLPNRMGKAPVAIPPRNEGRSMTRTLSASSDYVPMTSTVDDSYINWETIGSIRTQLLLPERHNPPPVSTKSDEPPPRFALDDLATVYMNLPIPEKPLVLPPRRQEREQQPTLQTIPGSSSRPTPSPRMPRPPASESPSTAKKPKPRPRVKTNTSQESDHVATVTLVNPVASLPPSTSSTSEAMDLLRPKCSPDPRHPHLNRAEIFSSSLPPSFGGSFGDSFGESFGGFPYQSPPEVSRRKLSDQGANEPQTMSLPPRNILRTKKVTEEML